MAIGKKPAMRKEINLDKPEVQNFINNGVTVPVQDKVNDAEKVIPVDEMTVEHAAEQKQENKRGRKISSETASIKYYNLPIPEDVFDDIEEYIFKKRKERKVTIRGFIIESIKEKIQREL